MAAGTEWVEARDAAKCLTMNRAVPTERIILPQMSVVLMLRDPGLKKTPKN